VPYGCTIFKYRSYGCNIEMKEVVAQKYFIENANASKMQDTYYRSQKGSSKKFKHIIFQRG